MTTPNSSDTTLDTFSKTLFSISELSYADIAEHDYYQQLHRIVSQLVHCDNFMVLLYKEQFQTLNIVYFSDQKDPAPTQLSFPLGEGITSFAIRQRTAVLLDAQSIKRHLAKGAIKSALGHLDSIVSWIGAPMLIDEHIYGALVIQSYSDEVVYQQAQLKLISYVAAHLASHLERRKSQQDHQRLLDELQRQHNELQTAHQLMRGQELSLIQQEKMASIGKLAGSVAHEINSPLGATLCNVQLLSEYLHTLSAAIPPSIMTTICQQTPDFNYIIDDSALLIQETEHALLKIKHTVQQLTVFHQQRHEWSTVLLKPLLHSTTILLRSTHNSVAEVDIHCPDDLSIHTIPSKLVQVLFGLLENAMVHGLPPFQLKAREDGQKLHLDIQDHGAGISSELQAQLFTQKHHHRSTHKGIGLALCSHTVNELDGELSIITSAQQGSCFRVTLPQKPPNKC